MEKSELDEGTINTFHWLLSELWNVLVLAKLGYYDMIDEKLEQVLVFLKENGITESAMSLDGELNKDALVDLINKFNK